MYLAGFNEFGQLESNNKERATRGSQACTHHLTLEVNLVSMNICFTWTNLFSLNEQRKLIAQGLKAGFKGDLLNNDLEKHKVKSLVSAGSCSVIIQDQEGSLWLHQQGDTQLLPLECPQDDRIIVEATEKQLVAVNGEKELYTANLTPDLKLDFSQPLAGLLVSSVSCGLEHVVLLSEDGQVYSYGSGSRGQLGHGELTVDRVTQPTLVESFEGIHVTSVACGGWHSTAVTADGDVYVWGWNESGQLGLPNGKESDSTSTDKTRIKTEHVDEREQSQRMCSNSGDVCSFSKGSFEIPIRIVQRMEAVQVQIIPYGLDLPDDLKVKKTSCGTRHTCVLFESGILMTCGWNNYGQLCHGDTRSRDFLETVQYLVDKHEEVLDVKAECWNTAVRVRNKR